MYLPKPKDLSCVEIPEEIIGLIELIAADIHDTWAAGRISEGWTYGETRDDVRKTSPCLVPYEELPENEKEYDRRAAKSTIQQILCRGYTISKESGGRDAQSKE